MVQRTPLGLPAFRPVTAKMALNERFRNLRANYRDWHELVALGEATWGAEEDVYELGDWVGLFTPIESAAWSDIRAWSLPIWPQLPVGRFFVDFGNPVHRVALECDGRHWHDPVKDAARDRELGEKGWTVFRAPGWRCKEPTDLPSNWGDLDIDQKAAFLGQRDERSLTGILKDIRDLTGGLL